MSPSSLERWVMIALIGTGAVPEVFTLADCESVEIALGQFDRYTADEQDALAESGQACTTAFPAIYGPAPYQNGNGYGCNLFHEYEEIACVRAQADATLAGIVESACPEAGNQYTTGTYCYQIVVEGDGYTDVAQTAGEVTTFSSSNGFDLYCEWDTGASSCGTGFEWDYFWYGPNYNCEVLTLRITTTTGNLYALPNGHASHTDTAYCGE